MSGRHPWSEIRDKLREDPAMEARINEYKRAMDDVLRLAELRNQHGKTQTQLAETMGVSQARVSQIESAENPYLETLREYVEALGGELEVRAVFPDETVTLVVPTR
ncbi:MAG: helix-turn-helix domain-containing protein [Thermomicrobiales bacterium]